MSTFDALFVPAELREAVSDRAWVEAMLQAEGALARASARAGVIPPDAAESIAGCCRVELFDPIALAQQGRAVGNPAEPLVRALRDVVGGTGAEYVHWGATSQDIADTAAMLVSRRALGLVLGELEAVAATCAALADAHRATPMAARTLLQQAVPTTFGLKAAGWLASVLEARTRLIEVNEHRLAAQLGGAAGTLAALGDAALDVLRLFAEELDISEPVLPWHSNRTRIVELAGALDLASGAAAKIALDVVLLAQTEVGEVSETGGGRSSTMPHKRNPVGSTLTLACARLAHGSASVLTGGLAHEHERAAGAWQSEWPALSDTLAFAGGALTAIREALTGLEVDTARMRENLGRTRGAVMAERLSFLLRPRLGRVRTQEHLDAALLAATASETGLRSALLADGAFGLSAAEVDRALDPTGYTGSAGALVDRALQRYRDELGVAA